MIFECQGIDNHTDVIIVEKITLIKEYGTCFDVGHFVV